MNTKTMRLPPRRVLTASASANAKPSVSASTSKRKERDEGFDKPKPSTATTTTTTTTRLLKPDKPKSGSEPTSSNHKGSEPSNMLVAGYLANEFLTKGTLLGEPWDPIPAEGPTTVEKMKGEATETPCRNAEQPETEEKRCERYVEVASLLKEDGAQLNGVVNPTQLARMLQL